MNQIIPASQNTFLDSAKLHPALAYGFDVADSQFSPLYGEASLQAAIAVTQGAKLAPYCWLDLKTFTCLTDAACNETKEYVAQLKATGGRPGAGHRRRLPGASVLAALGIGLVSGMVNGLLVAVLRVPPLITTLGTFSIGEGIARVYTGNSPILSVPPAYKALGSAYFGPLPLPTLILLTVTLALVFVVHRMTVGKQIYAVGGNAVAAR